MPHRINIREGWFVVGLLCLTVLTAYPAVMTTLAPYDDQGYIMMTLRSFLDGRVLYEEIHTQYGTAFYLLSGSLHETLGIPLSQDGVRLKTIAFWCLSTLLVYSILRRLGTIDVIAFLVSAIFHLHLHKLALEPGHPQEWILVLSLAAIWIVVGENSCKWLFAAILIGMIGMTKINCGVIFAIPLVIQSLYAGNRNSLVRAPVVQVVSGGAISALAVTGLSMAMGISIDQLMWGLIGQHRQFTGDFFHFVPMSPIAIIFGFTCLWIGYKSLRHQRTGVSANAHRSTGIEYLQVVLFVVVAFVSAFLVVADWSTPLIHGLEPRGAANWLVIVGPAISIWLLTIDSPVRMYRSFLILITFLSPLMAYPTPGTQMSLGTVPCWIVIGIIASSYVRKFVIDRRDNALEGDRSEMSGLGKMNYRAGARAVMTLTLFLCLIAGAAAWGRWLSNTPITLRGSHLLRLNQELVDREMRIVEAIAQTGCHHLIFDGHNHNRFYFWTDTVPLTDANPTFWPRMITSREQSRILGALGQTGQVCMVVPPESDQLASDRTKALRDTMYRSWEEIERVDDWKIGIIRSP